MAEHRHEFPLEKMAEVFGTSRSGFYEFANRGVSNREKQDLILIEKVVNIHEDNRYTYGRPQIMAELKENGIACGTDRLRKLLKTAGISVRTASAFKVTTDSHHDLPISPNLLSRNFRADAPNQVWVSDITYIRTRRGWLYLCLIVDLFSRKIVGWSMKNHMETSLVLAALRMAYEQRRPAPGLIFHSDRGSQYASLELRAKLSEYLSDGTKGFVSAKNPSLETFIPEDLGQSNPRVAGGDGGFGQSVTTRSTLGSEIIPPWTQAGQGIKQYLLSEVAAGRMIRTDDGYGTITWTVVRNAGDGSPNLIQDSIKTGVNPDDGVTSRTIAAYEMDDNQNPDYKKVIIQTYSYGRAADGTGKFIPSNYRILNSDNDDRWHVDNGLLKWSIGKNAEHNTDPYGFGQGEAPLDWRPRTEIAYYDNGRAIPNKATQLVYVESYDRLSGEYIGYYDSLNQLHDSTPNSVVDANHQGITPANIIADQLRPAWSNTTGFHEPSRRDTNGNLNNPGTRPWFRGVR